jgi:hypothetical protein
MALGVNTALFSYILIARARGSTSLAGPLLATAVSKSPVMGMMFTLLLAKPDVPAAATTIAQATSSFPIIPQNFRYTDVTDAQVFLAWDTDGSASSYTLTRTKQNSSLVTTISGLTGGDYTDDGLEEETSYNYTLVGVGPTGLQGPAASLNNVTTNSSE